MDGTGQARRSGGKQARAQGAPRMPVSTKARARRLAPETAQEKRSKGQFNERLGEVGWNEFRPETDLGEDYAIQIHDGGASTGLSFYVQLKSIQDAQRHRPKRGAEELRYRLEVKDLERWEVQTTPVVLVVWDVRARRGYWQMIPKIVADLERSNPAWRDQKTVMVSVPMDQGTDDAGLQKLRWAVANHQEPLVPKIGAGEISFSFPPTPEGRAAAQALRYAINTGDSTTVDGSFMTSIRLPEWHERLYGPPEKPVVFELAPRSSDKPVPIRVEIETPEGQYTIPHVELRARRIGRKRVSFTNEHQPSPLRVTMTLEDMAGGPSCKFSMGRARPGRTVIEEKESLGLLLALRHTGARLRVIDLESGVVLIRSPVLSPDSTDSTIESLRRHYEMIDKLCFIQARTQFGEFAVRDSLTQEEAQEVDELFRIVRDGKLMKVMSFESKVKPAQGSFHHILTNTRHIALHAEDAGTVEFLGVHIPLGPMRIIVCDRARFIQEYRRALQQAGMTGKPARFTIKDLPVIEEYLNYLPASSSHDRLHEFASGHAGYFTLGQALAAGYSSADILEAEERVERLAGDVFRLVQFPRSEHEDLLVLWLRSKQKGVFSHDTALSLHRLSDVLPSRLHLTLPPEYHPPDGSLGDGVDVHHAPIEDSDITWIGPIPVTKPLRTLRDCIEDHLSPDLIDQALDDAYQRGLIAEEDLEALQTARAKSA